MDNYREIELKDLILSKTNPRKATDKKQDMELLESVKAKGVITPIKVRPVGSKYEIVFGSRRHAAAMAAGLKTIPAVVQKLTDEQVMEQQVIENLQHADLNPIDEAKGFETMLTKFKWSQKDLATRVGKNEKYISVAIRLLKLPDRITKAIQDGTLTPGHGVVLLRLNDPKDQANLFQEIVNQKLSVRRAENELDNYGHSLGKVPFDKTECRKCEFNGDKQTELFDSETDVKNKCLDKTCFIKKINGYIQRTKLELEKKGCEVMTEEKFEEKYDAAHDYSETKSKNLSQDYVKNKLGKAYKAECMGCKKRVYVITNQINGEIIQERCTDVKCYKRLTRTPTEKSTGADNHNQELNEHKTENLVREAKRVFWSGKLSNHLTSRIKKAIMLDMMLGQLTSDIDGNEVLPKSFTGSGYTQWTLKKLYDMGDKLLDECIEKIIKSKAARIPDDEDFEYLNEIAGFKVVNDWVITREYLTAHTKDQLVRIANEIGLVHHNSKKDGSTDEATITSMSNESKLDLVEMFFDKTFELEGKVPKEMLK